MKYAEEMDPVRRRLMVLCATMFDAAMEGMDEAVAECRRKIEELRRQHPEIVEAYLKEIAEAEQLRDPETVAAYKAMAG